MKTLEEEIQELRDRIAQLDARLRLQRVVETFPETPILPEDHFVCNGAAGTLHHIYSDGKWHFSLGRSNLDGPPPPDPQRLFTLDEVKQIVAEASQKK